MDIVIKAEQISKLYRLGEVGTGTLSHDLNRWIAKVRGKEDPFAKVGETNDRTRKGNSDYVWALKDLSFEVGRGEVLGIIGRNGAGKSTLLKLLSKVTKPTAGQIRIRGRIASLLEVGTGFHPEMTGRENIFLNGTILGMTKREIKSKLDEIIDFAGIARYVDTPVKRYSSGMHVRLAFAVAAFLEPEILIVDEVLAVGDAEFQKKCVGRMKDVSANDGRTILFVSHDMTAINQLCHRSLLLEGGELKATGPTSDIIATYQRSFLNSGFNEVRVDSFCAINRLVFNSDVYTSGDPATITLALSFMQETNLSGLALLFYNELNQRIAIIDLRNFGIIGKYDAGQTLTCQVEVSEVPFIEGTYNIGLYIESGQVRKDITDIIRIVVNERKQGDIIPYLARYRGVLNLNANCKVVL